MSLSVNTKTGDQSEHSDITNRSLPPVINIQLQLSCKDASADNLPHAFKPRPKLSRTPPNSTDSEIKNDTSTPNNHSDNTKTDDSDTSADEIYQSSKFQSPSISIEYPPGSSIPIIKKRKKFQFKKTHRQKFSGTSSAKKTNEIRNNKERQNSRSNILLSYHSYDTSNIEISPQNATNLNATKTTQTRKQSLPASPPSDDVISTLNQIPKQSPHKLLIHMTTNSNSGNFIATNKDSQCNQSPSTVSSSCTQKQCTALMHKLDREASKSLGKTATTPTMFVSARANFRPNKPKYATFGSKSDLTIDPDQIRIALDEYDMQKGQNLEEIFRPRKTCCNCVVL